MTDLLGNIFKSNCVYNVVAVAVAYRNRDLFSRARDKMNEVERAVGCYFTALFVAFCGWIYIFNFSFYISIVD